MSTTTTKCTSILKSMHWCEGKPVKPGIRRKAYVAAKADVATYPKLERDDLGRPTSAAYKGNLVLAEGKKFQVIDHLPEKAEPKSDPQGEFPSQTFNNQLTLVCPDVGPEATAAITPFLNTEVIVLVEDMYGRFRMFGGEDYGARIAPSQALGQGATGTSATTLVITASDEVSMPFYSGTIPTEDGTINDISSNAETGTVGQAPAGT